LERTVPWLFCGVHKPGSGRLSFDLCCFGHLELSRVPDPVATLWGKELRGRDATLERCASTGSSSSGDGVSARAVQRHQVGFLALAELGLLATQPTIPAAFSEVALAI
jgi:hypothetical protein